MRRASTSVVDAHGQPGAHQAVWRARHMREVGGRPRAGFTPAAARMPRGDFACSHALSYAAMWGGRIVCFARRSHLPRLSRRRMRRGYPSDTGMFHWPSRCVLVILFHYASAASTCLSCLQSRTVLPSLSRVLESRAALPESYQKPTEVTGQEAAGHDDFQSRRGRRRRRHLPARFGNMRSKRHAAMPTACRAAIEASGCAPQVDRLAMPRSSNGSSHADEAAMMNEDVMFYSVTLDDTGSVD